MRRWLLILIVVALLAAGGWAWGSPYLAVRSIERAAEARDAEALSARVDYPALRKSMKTQLRARFASGDDGALGALVATGIADSIVDAAITPEGIRAIFATGVAEAARERRPVDLDARDMTLRRDALDRFRLVRRDGKGGALLFGLRGLQWKLVGIELPPERKGR
ncbi:MAG: DUF2939 domain-containing protein [Sphingomonas sp.]|uniref:DUF2939 domain-containing protein n=1 Tax=Sphingomonas sp. TaxID=28214 RepID=UPI001B2B75A5|nr:DUF2939 domain-containing protein [Sphingomonas sp.]MBO9623215.1 DUF2939 domain-containing protein [Sphingomonas sp.]